MQFSHEDNNDALSRSKSCPAEIWSEEIESTCQPPTWGEYKTVLELWCMRQRIVDFPFKEEKFNFDGMTNEAKTQFVWSFKIALDI